jgi:uncharacterized protein YggE
MMRQFFLLSLLGPALAFGDGGLPNQPYIYVQGEAQVESPPDMVTMNFSVVATNLDQEAANKQAQEAATRILAMLDANKIPEKDVTASNLKAEPQYERDENSPANRGKLIGYTVTRPFTVKLHDLGILARLVDDLVATKGVEFAGIEPGLSNQKEIQQQAQSKALAIAREQAETTLKLSNMKIASTFALSPVPFPAIQQEMLGSAGNPVLSLNRDLVTKGDPTRYRLAPITVSQTIHVIYLTSPLK